MFKKIFNNQIFTDIGKEEILVDKYKYFKGKISKKYTIKEYQKNLKESQNNKLTLQEKRELDKTMHSQICSAVSANEVALPTKSKHEKGNAIDTQTSKMEDRACSLLWYSIEFSDKNHVLNITAEDNGCVHFEFSS